MLRHTSGTVLAGKLLSPNLGGKGAYGMPNPTYPGINAEPSSGPRHANQPWEERLRTARRTEPSRAKWIAVAALVAAGLVAFVYSTPLEKWMETSPVVGKLSDGMAAATDRLRIVESQIGAIKDETAELRAAEANLDRRVTEVTAASKKVLTDAGAALRREWMAANANLRATSDARIAALEREQRTMSEANAKLAARADSLQRELTQVNGRLASMDTHFNKSMQIARADAAQSNAEIREFVNGVSARADRTASYVDRPRVRFEAKAGGSTEIAPGILLHVTRTNISHRRFHGWIHLVEDGKIIWLRDQSSLQSIPFQTGKQALRNDLIVTGLTKAGVTGYLVFPSKGEARDAFSAPRESDN